MHPLQRTGVAQLRLAANLSEMCVESFWDRFTAEEVLALFRACWACGWDFLPDEWTEAQVQGALRGFPPEWQDDETPRLLPLLVPEDGWFAPLDETAEPEWVRLK